jgi:hypothetical protein
MPVILATLEAKIGGLVGGQLRQNKNVREKVSQKMVALICNPSYAGDRNRRIMV